MTTTNADTITPAAPVDLAAMVDRVTAEAAAPPPPPPREPTAVEIEAAMFAMTDRGYRPVCRAAWIALAQWAAARHAGLTARGLLLWGPAGLGKTHYLRTMLPAIRMATAPDVVRFWHESDGALEVTLWKAWRYGEEFDLQHPVCLDDLGQEPMSVSYGQREEFADRLLSRRYEAFKRNGVRTYVTTNLTPAALEARYGRRVTDRLAEMCAWVEFAGKSARQA
jgi:DNA replication protein DnaC